jgi:hypothetical protein
MLREVPSVRFPTASGRFVSLAAASCVFAFAGCGGVSTDYSGLGLVQVSGAVTLDGKPLSGAAVYFEPTDKSVSRSYATTDASGNYVLEFDSKTKGVTAGEKIVRIEGKGLGGEEVVEADGEGASASKPADSVPACYNAESKLKATVTGSQTMNFDLKSDCSVTGPTS